MPSSRSSIFRRALTLISAHRAGDEKRMAASLSELSDPVLAGEVVAALLQIVTVLHRENPTNLDEWIESALLHIAIRGDE